MKKIFIAILVWLIAGSFCLVMVGCGEDTMPEEELDSPADQVYSDE